MYMKCQIILICEYENIKAGRVVQKSLKHLYNIEILMITADGY